MTGSSALTKRRVERESPEVDKKSKKQDNTIKLFFNPGHYTVMENVGSFSVTVTREGYLNQAVCVDFKTEDGTAEAGSDYEPVEGTLIFQAGEAHKQVRPTFGKHSIRLNLNPFPCVWSRLGVH